jgi:hypothetical protein
LAREINPAALAREISPAVLGSRILRRVRIKVAIRPQGGPPPADPTSRRNDQMIDLQRTRLFWFSTYNQESKTDD